MYTEKQRHILYLALFVFVLSICLYIMPMVLNEMIAYTINPDMEYGTYVVGSPKNNKEVIVL